MKKLMLFLVLLFAGLLVACTDTENPEITEYRVTFNGNGGSPVIDPVTIEEGNFMDEPTVTRNNYEFLGWFFNDLKWEFDVMPVLSDMELTAHWRFIDEVENEYTVSFNPDGGILSGDSEIEVIENSFIEEPQVSKDNYEFLGWFTSANTLWDFDTMRVTSNMTLTARWKLINNPGDVVFIVTFNPNGGETTSSLEVEVLENNKITAPQITRDGYRLVGWFTKDNVKWNFSNDLVTDYLTLTAVWEEFELPGDGDYVVYEHNFQEQGKNSNYLTFDSSNNLGSNYGTYTFEEYEYTQGYKIDSKGHITFTTDEDNLTLLIVVGRREDAPTHISVGSETRQIVSKHEVFEFELNEAGTYQIARQGGNKEYGIFYLRITRDVETALVTFDTKGGSLVDSQRVELGSLITLPAEPVRTDYDFIGWFVDEDYTIQWDFASDLAYEDLTLYAKWDQLPEFTVTIDGQEHFVKEGRLIDVEPEQILGKVFLGWFTQTDDLFSPNTPVTEDLQLTSKYRDAEEYTITFDLDGGEIVDDIETLTFYENQKVELPEVSKDGFIFAGFYLDLEFTNAFSQQFLTSDITLYVFWLEVGASEDLSFGAYFESLWVEWEDSLNSNVSVTYQQVGSSGWQTLDDELVRQINGGSTVRADIVGIEAGHYNVLINTSTNSKLFANSVEVMPHDRSGYAHFNYTEGIGAYNDDGTLKDNAVVVYVTDQNKDTITIPGLNHLRTGIGWILNNNQYNSSSSNTQSAQEYQNSLAYFNKPIVIRFIGKVTSPEGLTIYNSTDQGGSRGDNGHMARIRDGNNITLEGIGEDAIIEGWGIHLIAASVGRGIGFEVRNLTFDKYPEDAIGLEGQQSGSVLTIPVQRGWIHNSTFLPGYAANPAESDKAEGDGSLDVKRGEYFTISYNQFISGSKTNLVGSGDSSLQYHITYHHNLWENSRSRIPLARQANIHMYNNVFETNANQTLSTDYVQNTRANAYIFSEANYFSGVKRPSYVQGGAIKSYNDVKYSIWNTNNATHVTNRETLVSSGNKFENFDTDPTVFYYDAVNKVSDVARLTDAVTARREVYQYSGTYRSYDEVDESRIRINNITPTLIEDSVEMNTPTKILKETPILVFEILTDATFEMVSVHNVPATLVDIYGREMLTGSGMVELQPGVYSIQSSINTGYSKGVSEAKESHITSYKITLDSGAASQARIDNATQAFNALPETVDYTSAHLTLINNAQNAYNHLRGDEALGFDQSIITTKLNQYVSLGVTVVQNAINNIGVVDENSLSAIQNARNAYNNAIPQVKEGINNLSVLINAETDFEEFKVSSLNNYILQLSDVSLVDITNLNEINLLLEEYLVAVDLYEGLGEDLVADVVGYSKVLTGVSRLEELLQPYDIIEFLDGLVIEDITYSNGSELTYYYNLYIDLEPSLQVLLSSEQVKLLNDAWDHLQHILSQSITHVLYFGNENSALNGYFTGTLSENKDPKPKEGYYYDGVLIQKVYELNSTARINFTVTAPTATLRIQFERGSTFKLNDEVINYSEGELLEITLTAGTYLIERNQGSNNNIAWIEVIEQGS